MYLCLLHFLPLTYKHFLFVMTTRILHDQGFPLLQSLLEEISCVHLVGVVFIASSLCVTTKSFSITVLFLACEGMSYKVCISM